LKPLYGGANFAEYRPVFRLLLQAVIHNDYELGNLHRMFGDIEYRGQRLTRLTWTTAEMTPTGCTEMPLPPQERPHLTGEVSIS
jgi:hypothetical protein